MNEQQFVSKVNNISMLEASKVLQKLNESQSDWFLLEAADIWCNDKFLTAIKEKLHIDDKLIQDLHLGLIQRDDKLFLGIPALYNNIVMDVRQHNILQYAGVPKIMSNKGAESGWVIPYDLWLHDHTTTYVVEGEKDMMAARMLGLNAITLTGGAQAKPNSYVINSFKDREVIICYDNDDAGREGAGKLFKELHTVAKSVRYVRIGDVVKENKEDFFDYVHKYNGTIWEFLSLEQHEFELTEEKEQKTYHTISFALTQNKIKQKLSSKVTVSGEFADTYAVPEYVTLEKGEETGGKNEFMFKGEKRTWYLDHKKPQEILQLIELGAKNDEINAKLRRYVGIDLREPNISIKAGSYRSVYKTRVTDSKVEGSQLTLDLYSFESLTVGKQYEIDYRIMPHPTKNQKLIAISDATKPLNDLAEFKPNKDKLQQFISGATIEEKLDYLYQSAKHHIAKHLNFNIWLMNDLVFNSILEIKYGELIKGALDVFVLGDTQVGKSETAQKLVDLYNFGHFLSLKTSSTVGLIGGSNKVEGSWLNTIGAIPRQHRGLAVLEEFSGARADFIQTMTDVRSSGKLRLARAAGEMDVDCRLRMITISNPVNDENGNPRHLSTFPNGVIPIMELIKSAEDVARYDGFLLAQKPTSRINPFSLQLKGRKIAKELYEHKIMWVATRTPDNVKFADGSDSYIWEKAEELNSRFESSFPLFTTTTSLKLARFSVALASLIVSTDETFENVVVTKEIVDYIVDWFYSIYDNDVFKLREYREEYESYSNITASEISELQKLYSRNATLLDFLAHQSVTSQQTMRATSGLDGDKFNPVFNKLVQLKFIKLVKGSVSPTRKFIIGMTQIDKALLANTESIESTSTNDKIF